VGYFTSEMEQNIPKTNGIMKLSLNSDGTLFEYVEYGSLMQIKKNITDYTSHTLTSYIFTLKRKTLNNSNRIYTNNNNTNVNIHFIEFYLRNYSDNFTEINQEEFYYKGDTGNNKQAENFFDFFVIPTTEEAKFAGSKTLKDIYISSRDNFIPNPTSLPFIYRPSNSKITTSPPLSSANPGSITQQEIRKNIIISPSTLMIYFWTFYILGKFDGGTLWQKNGLNGYPTLAKIKTNTEAGTIFTWNKTMDSLQGFMYEYCEKNSTCGDCYGVNKNNKQVCLVTSKTREHIKELNSTLVDLDIKPLADDINFHSDHNEMSEGPRQLYNIICTACSSIIIIISIISCFLLIYKKRDSKLVVNPVSL
jgi:hypothetical protein